MSFLLACPNCGPRNVHEFTYGGEIVPPPDRPPGTAGTNLPGVQRERWYHRLGCRRWFAAERDVSTNAVHRTGWFALHPESSPTHPGDEEGRGEAAVQGGEP
jgi:sarcosine oxidase subunit delta